MNRPETSVRDATAADLPAIAALQAASWRDAYAGLVPATFLGPDLDARLAAQWAALPGEGGLVRVAVAGGELRGFAAVRLDPAAPAYLDNLHVDPALRGGGIGRALMADLAATLTARGERALYLTVLCRNLAARAFYRAMGGCEGPPATDRMHGLAVDVHRVDWHDLAALAAAARGP